MIGYVQGRDIPAWSVQLDRWIEGLAGDAVEGWSDIDKLAMVEHDTIARIASLRSDHARRTGLDGDRRSVGYGKRGSVSVALGRRRIIQQTQIQKGMTEECTE